MDIRKAIEKLNSIDAKDFKNIDFSKLKEFDLARIKEELVTKPKLLINTIFIFTAIATAIHSLSGYQLEGRTTKTEVTEMKQRLNILEQNSALQAEYNQFLADFPESIPNNQMIGKISEFAEASHVNIISFSPTQPSQPQETEYTLEYVISLNVSVQSYQDLVDFVHALETSNYVLRIDKWNIHPQRTIESKKGKGEVPLDVHMEIISIHLKDV
ncbi:MAG TPA: type 4a pilus biogenesis protein PilO [Candidatus Omnitrophota bacterium]|nr:type 4a pilus biogenesis protein PilO [Candidatus Omnitrophota bacterium]